MTTKFRVAVVSDLHAIESASDAEHISRINLSAQNQNATTDPLIGLKDLISKNTLTADLLVCAGDMGNKAQPAAIRHVWKELQELKALMGCNHMIGTAGNHDVDSRYQYNNYDAKGILLGLEPMFPGFKDEPLCNKYWARNYAILEEQDWRLIVLNTSAYHGVNNTKNAEYGHGRVSISTISSIKAELEKAEPKSVNLLLCHHHPIRNTAIDLDDYSEMEGGDLLISMLDKCNCGQWVIIHGHKHHPKISYANGSSNSPIIFSAGSLSAHLYPELATIARNQFYILEFCLTNLEDLKLDVAAKIAAWDWIDFRGWQPATKNSGLPQSCGFGSRHSGQKYFVKELIEWVKSKQEPYVTWEEVCKQFPKLEFTIPDDIDSIIQQLGQSLTISYSETGRILQVAPK